jgi:hypothetical protein
MMMVLRGKSAVKNRNAPTPLVVTPELRFPGDLPRGGEEEVGEDAK